MPDYCRTHCRWNGFQFGTYESGTGANGGIAEGGLSLDLSYSKEAEKIKDLEEESDVYGGSAAYIGGVGYDYSKSINDPNLNLHTLHITGGLALEGHIGQSDTKTQKLYSWGSKPLERMREIAEEGKNAKDALKKAFNKDYKRLTGDAGRHVSIILIKGDFRDNTIYYQGKYQLLCYGEC